MCVEGFRDHERDTRDKANGLVSRDEVKGPEGIDRDEQRGHRFYSEKGVESEREGREVGIFCFSIAIQK